MERRLKINMVSESGSVPAQGVHTAFLENFNSLKRTGRVDIEANGSRPADIIHMHTIGPKALRKMLFGRGKKVISAHVTPDSFVGSLVGAKYWYKLAQAYLRWYYNRADGVIAVSSEVVDELRKFGVYKPIYLVPNTIDTSAFATDAEGKHKAREVLGIKQDDFLIMCSGQVQPRKGIATFMACAKALPDYKFVWVGGIPFGKVAADHEEMEKLMKNPPQNLLFTGIIPREKLIDYYQASDLFFLPSHQETFGLVIVEAASAGVPVLLRDIPQYLKTFKSYYTAGAEKTFVELIRRFDQDKAFYKDEAAKAHNIAEMYDSKKGAERLIEVYTEVLEGKREDLPLDAKAVS